MVALSPASSYTNELGDLPRRSFPIDREAEPLLCRTSLPINRETTKDLPILVVKTHYREGGHFPGWWPTPDQSGNYETLFRFWLLHFIIAPLRNGGRLPILIANEQHPNAVGYCGKRPDGRCQARS
jgi:hypothetical protein